MSQEHVDDLDPDKYDLDEDRLPRQIIGNWAREKYERVRKYVGISGGVRKSFIGPGNAGATYIDLFSGPGRARIKETGEVVAGSPLVAWNESVARKTPFSAIHVSDASIALSQAAAIRLKRLGAPVSADTGLAEDVVERVIARLNPYALHFAFLDPYSLSALPFSVIQRLATLERMDILIHFSTQDLNRNLARYLRRTDSPLDRFAPGWRDHVGDLDRAQLEIRGKIFEHWRMLLKSLGMETDEDSERVSGPTNQPLYWLAFTARHERALEFWEKIRTINPKSGSLFDADETGGR